MAFIFSSDPGSLANQRLATDRTNIDLAENNRRAQQQAIDTYNQQQIAAQRQAEEDARQSVAQQFSFQQSQASQAANQRAEATDAFRFNLGQQDKAAQEKERVREFNVNTDLTRQQFGQSEGSNDFANLMKAIQAGDITSPDDIEATYTHLTPQQKAMAAAHLTNVTSQKAQEYQQGLGAAAAATRQITEGIPSWVLATAKPIQEEDAMSRLSRDKTMAKYLPMLKWDEDNQQFVPILRKPSVPTSGTATNLNAPPSNPLSPVAAPISPTVTAAAQPGFNFATPQTNAPVTAMNRGQMVSRPLTADIAAQLLQQTGGDKNKARQLAAQLGYTF